MQEYLDLIAIALQEQISCDFFFYTHLILSAPIFFFFNSKEEDEAFLNNKYHARRSQNSNYLFNDNSKFLSLTFINNNLALQQYIKDQRTRQKNIEKGKLRVNYVSTTCLLYYHIFHPIKVAEVLY